MDTLTMSDSEQVLKKKKVDKYSDFFMKSDEDKDNVEDDKSSKQNKENEIKEF